MAIDHFIKDIYRITLLDGRTIECSDTHDWYLYNISKGKYETKNIKEIESSRNTISKKMNENHHNQSEDDFTCK